jgi:hypothetical protein
MRSFIFGKLKQIWEYFLLIRLADREVYLIEIEAKIIIIKKKIHRGVISRQGSPFLPDLPFTNLR